MGRTLLIVMALGSLAGCSVKLDVPTGVEIDCQSKSECPAGFVCNPTTHRCIDAESPDTESPSVEAIEIIPAVARQGVLVTVRLTMSESIDQGARLFFDDAGGREDLVLVTAVGRELTFTYTPSGAETEGAHSLFVDLSDAVGNPLRGVVEAALVFDFTPPALVEGSASVTVTPAAHNPLLLADAALGGSLIPRLASATTGSVITASFVVAERVADPASQVVVRATAGPTTRLDLVPTGQEGSTFVFELEVEGGHPEGSYAVEVEVTDDAGARASFPLAPLITIDQTAPPAPAVGVDGAIVYRREPHGSAAQRGTPHFSVRAQDAAFEPLSYAMVFAGPSRETVLVSVGQTTSVGGLPSVSLPALDRRELYAGAMDAAGNLSSILRIDNVEWLGSLGGKVSGSTMENPSSFYLAPRFADTLQQPGATEADAQSGLAEEDCLAPGCAGAAETRGLGFWRRDKSVNGNAEPDDDQFAPRYGMAYAFDPARRVAVFFGGDDRAFPYARYNDTWEWDGIRWSRRATTGPSPRSQARMVYDENLGRVVLFGGSADQNSAACPQFYYLCNDVWAWDGASWTSLSPTGGPPPHRAGHGMVYDQKRARTVVFAGGAPSTTPHGDVWLLNCSTLPCSWSQQVISGPSTRVAPGMTYDAANERALVYGGLGPYDERYDDLWQLTQGGWLPLVANQASGQNLGVTRHSHWLAYDASREEVLSWGVDRLFSNQENALTCGRPWRLDDDAIACPANARAFDVRDVRERNDAYSLFYPPTATTVVVGPEETGIMHQWDGGAQEMPAHVFSAAFGVAAGNNAAVLVDRIDFQPVSAPTPVGYRADFGAEFGPRGDGREYGWLASCVPQTFDANSAESPDQRYDTYLRLAKRGQASFEYNCVWEYALANGRYTVSLVAGKADVSDLPGMGDLDGLRYAFDVEGVAAVDRRPTLDVPFVESSVVVDVTDGRLTVRSLDVGVPYDNIIAFLEISRATEIDAVDVRFAAGGSGQAYDPAVEVTGAASYSYAVYAVDTTVTLDSDVASDWRDDPSGLLGRTPNRLWDVSVVSRREFSGSGSGTVKKVCLFFNDAVAETHCVSPNRSLAWGQGYHALFDLRGAGFFPVSELRVAVTLNGTFWEGVDVTLHAHAVAGASSDGATLFGYENGAWRSLVSNDASASAPQALVWSTATSAQATRLLVGASRSLSFAVAPNAPNGVLQTGAAVTSDYVEALVRYRLSRMP